MKAGIYLGPPMGPKGLVRTLLWLAVLGTLAHGAVFFPQRADLVAARRRLESYSDALEKETPGDAPREWSLSERAILGRLRLIADSGATSAIAPTDVLRLLEDALPDRVALVEVSFEASAARPSLTLDARAERAEDVTTLQEAIASSPLVSATELLSERRTRVGVLSVRLKVDLVGERRP